MPVHSDPPPQFPTKDFLSWCFDEPQYDLDKTIMVDATRPSRSYTGRQCLRGIRQLAAGFTKLGLKPGDTVLVHAFSDIDYPLMVNGIVAFGGVFAGTNPSYTAAELTHHIRLVHAQMIVVERDMLGTALRAASTAGLSADRILVFDHEWDQESTSPESLSVRSWKTLFGYGERDWVRFEGEQEVRKRPIALLGTSGTTGFPKAAILTHFNMMAEHTLLNIKPKPYEVKRIWQLPMYHVATVPATHFSTLRSGDTIYVGRRFSVESFCRTVAQNGVTEAVMVPPMVLAIINSPLPNSSPEYNLDSLRWCIIGAAPLGVSEQRRFRQLLNPDLACANQLFGMTEGTGMISLTYWPEDDSSGSLGRMMPGVDAKIVNEDGQDITEQDGAVGELCIRGPIIISGYLENPEANSRDWDEDGFFHSGDIMRIERTTRRWFIVDRKKELIKVRGFQVAPPELESVLQGHPLIEDAAVIGVRSQGSDFSGELPRAYVQLKQQDEPTHRIELNEEMVKAYVAERVAKYKRLDGGVCFIDKVPRNPSGKILKRVLRERATKEIRDAKL